MHGISTIVELLLITLLLITLVSLLWMFTSGTINVIARSGTNQTQRTQEIFSTCMLVDSVYGNTVYLKNCGYGVITNDSLGIYLDDTPLKFSMTPQKIGKGEVGTITVDTLGLNKGDYDLKISNPNLEVVQQVEAVLPDSCVLALDFDEGSGGTAYDSSGHGNNGVLSNLHGTIYGNTHWVEGKYGYGLSFDGKEDYLLIDSLPLGSNPNNGPVTITLWFKTSDVTPFEDKYLFSDGGWTEMGFRLLKSGKFQAMIFQPAESSQAINDSWHFAALSYDYNNRLLYLYLDGQLQGDPVYITDLSNGFNDEPFAIGAGYQDIPMGFFNGIIDEVRVWNSYLTQAQIQAEMQSPTPIIEPVWSFKEPTDMWTDGKFGKALSFDGLNDYVQVPDNSLFQGGNMKTLEAWVKPSSVSTRQIIIEKGDTNLGGAERGPYFLAICEDGRVVVDVYDTTATMNGFASSSVLNPNNWYHLVLVINTAEPVAADQVKLYINGFKETRSSNGCQGNNVNNIGTIRSNTQPLLIGIRDTQGTKSIPFSGTIDSVRIYNKALTPDQIGISLKMK